MDRIAFGTDTGHIYLLPALKLISHLFVEQQNKEDFSKRSSLSLCPFVQINHVDLDVQTLLGHNQAITCLIHPHSEYSRYDIQHLLSGSMDHSIRLWDLGTSTQLHMFTVHSGSILMFHIPPPMLNVNSSCSLDHSLADRLSRLGESSILCLLVSLWSQCGSVQFKRTQNRPTSKSTKFSRRRTSMENQRWFLTDQMFGRQSVRLADRNRQSRSSCSRCSRRRTVRLVQRSENLEWTCWSAKRRSFTADDRSTSPSNPIDVETTRWRHHTEVEQKVRYARDEKSCLMQTWSPCSFDFRDLSSWSRGNIIV